MFDEFVGASSTAKALAIGTHESGPGAGSCNPSRSSHLCS